MRINARMTNAVLWGLIYKEPSRIKPGTPQSRGGKRRVPNDDWTEELANEILTDFMKGMSIPAIADKYRRDATAIKRGLQKLAEHYSTVPIEFRGIFARILAGKKEPRMRWANNRRYKINACRDRDPLNINELIWFVLRFKVSKPKRLYGGMSWDDVVSESGRSRKQAKSRYKHLLHIGLIPIKLQEHRQEILNVH